MLNNRELKTLESYKRYHEHPPTFWSIFGRMVFRLHFWLIHLVTWTGAYVFFSTDRQQHAYIFIGISIGTAVRDIGYIMATVRIWPLIDSIVDWTKADEISKFGSLPN